MTNYNVKTGGKADKESKWKIFYSDKNNIFLISDKYIRYEKIPNGRDGMSLNPVNGYPNRGFFTNIINSTEKNKYNGSSDITNEKIKKLNEDYMGKYESSEANMKAVAYMLDTEAWSNYAGDYASYAIGGPTIEMFVNSYSQKHDVDYKAKATSKDGYQISIDGGKTWSKTGPWILDGSDSLYVLADWQKSGACATWLASPSDNGSKYLCRATFLSALNDVYGYDDQGTGFRPVICLDSKVAFEKDGEGYKIK